MSSSSRSRQALALAGLLLLLAACGKRGDPLPPPRNVPLATKELSLRQRGLEIILDLPYPTTTVSGLTLAGVEELEVLEAARPLLPPGPAPALDTKGVAKDAKPVPPSPTPAPEAQEPAKEAKPLPAIPLPVLSPKEFAKEAKPLLTLKGSELSSAVAGDRLLARFLLPEAAAAGKVVRFYAVRTRAKGGGWSDRSNVVSFLPKVPPAPPAAVAVTAKAEGIALDWKAVPGVVGYNVYRRQTDLTSYGAPLVAPEPTATQFLDSTARYGQRYFYTVCSVASRAPLVESALAAEREIDYQDRFPPVPPTDLAALPEVGKVRLVWRFSPSPDTVGYKIYRQDPGGEWRQLATLIAAGLEYLDTGLSSGIVFHYRVTAIDGVGNESGPSAEVETRVP